MAHASAGISKQPATHTCPLQGHVAASYAPPLWLAFMPCARGAVVGGAICEAGAAWVREGLHWSSMGQGGGHWSSMGQGGGNWSSMGQGGGHWSRMGRGGGGQVLGLGLDCQVLGGLGHAGAGSSACHW